MSLTTNLVAYWKLDEASGTRVDATGRGNNLSPTGSPGSAAGIINNAVDTSTGNVIERASTTDLVMGDIDFTIAAWIRFDAFSGSEDIVNKWASPFEYTLAYGGGANRFLFIVEPSGFNSVTANTLGALSIDTWYYVVVWHDAGANTINIQGNNGGVNSAAHTTGVTASTANFVIGRSGFGVAHNGRVDEVGVWKRILTASERTSLYNGGAGLAYPFDFLSPSGLVSSEAFGTATLSGIKMFGITIDWGAKYMRLKSLGASTITATIAGKT